MRLLTFLGVCAVALSCDLMDPPEERRFVIMPGRYSFELTNVKMDGRKYLLVSYHEAAYRATRDTIINRYFWESPEVASCLSEMHCNELMELHGAVDYREFTDKYEVCSETDVSVATVTECVSIGIAAPVRADNFYDLLDNAVDSIGGQALFRTKPGRCGHTWIAWHPLTAHGTKMPDEIMRVDTLRITPC